MVDGVGAVGGHVHAIDHHINQHALVPSARAHATRGLTDASRCRAVFVACDLHPLFGAGGVSV